jgi:hypothetical protein
MIAEKPSNDIIQEQHEGGGGVKRMEGGGRDLSGR